MGVVLILAGHPPHRVSEMKALMDAVHPEVEGCTPAIDSHLSTLVTSRIAAAFSGVSYHDLLFSDSATNAEVLTKVCCSGSLACG